MLDHIIEKLTQKSFDEFKLPNKPVEWNSSQLEDYLYMLLNICKGGAQSIFRFQFERKSTPDTSAKMLSDLLTSLTNDNLILKTCASKQSYREGKFDVLILLKNKAIITINSNKKNLYNISAIGKDATLTIPSDFAQLKDYSLILNMDKFKTK